VIKGHNAPVRFVDFSRSESLMATCSDDKTLKIWNLPDCSFQKSLLGHTNWVRTCRFGLDPNLCASGSDDGTVRVWDIERGENIVTYNVGSRDSISQPSVALVDFHPSNYILGASSTDGMVRLYDLRRDKIVQICSPFGQSWNNRASVENGPCGISFHPNGTGLLMSHRDGQSPDTSNVSFWDMRSQRMVYSVQHKEDTKPKNVSSLLPVSFSPDGLSFSSGFSDGTILIWKDNKLISSPSPKGFVSTSGRSEQLTNDDNKVDVPSSALEFIVKDTIIIPSPGPVQESSSSSSQKDDVDVNTRKFLQSCPPDVLIGTLEHIVGQLSMITQTIELIEKRVTNLEEIITKLEGHPSKC
jgi:centriolar protein POC1